MANATIVIKDTGVKYRDTFPQAVLPEAGCCMILSHAKKRRSNAKTLRTPTLSPSLSPIMGERNHLLPSPPGGEGSGERWNAKENIEKRYSPDW